MFVQTSENEMKVINLQIAFFFKQEITDGEAFANRLNSRLNKVFDKIEPHTIKLPNDMFINKLPMYEMTQSNGDKQMNILSDRCDLLYGPDILSQKSVGNTMQNIQNFVYSLFEAMTDERNDIYRMGIVLTTFLEEEHPLDYIANKYFSFKNIPIRELGLHVNLSDSTAGMNLNSLVDIQDGQIENVALKLRKIGVVFKRDINNIPVQDKVLKSGDLKSLWKYSLKRFNDKEMGEIKV